MEVNKFCSIEQFRNVKRNVEWKAQYVGNDEAGDPIMDRLAKLPTLKFRGTEKIHGSNASIRILPDSNIVCQSRERVITPGDDNYGFARFISNLPKEVLAELAYPAPDNTEIVIYGEWAGKGIQDKVSVSEVDKFWVIFEIKLVKGEEEFWVPIQEINFSLLKNYRIFNINDNKSWEIDINFESPGDAINQINDWTLEVEAQSPLGLRLGVDGIGEGIVWKCVSPGFESSKFWFKTKGDKHSGSKVTKLANVDVEKMKSIEDFVTKVVDEGRLTQGWNYLHENKLFDFEKSMGVFLKWVVADCWKEEKDTINLLGLTEREINREITKKAKRWYLTKLTQPI